LRGLHGRARQSSLLSLKGERDPVASSWTDLLPYGMQTLGGPEQPLGEKGTAVGTNQMPWSIRTTATYLIFSGEDDLIDSCSGIAGKVLRGCRIGSQAHSVALSLHNPNSIGLIVPILRRVPEPKAAIR
jgi:hypothetical protein